MCVVSAVHDYFSPLIPGVPAVPWPGPWAPAPESPPRTPEVPAPSPGLDPALFAVPMQLIELRLLIDRFERAVAAAKVVDELTGQPDCVDPEKAKLEDRVAYWKARALAAEKLVEAET